MLALRFPALVRIAIESPDLLEYARRAVRFAANCNPRRRPSTRMLVSMWLHHGRQGCPPRGRRLTERRARILDALEAAAKALEVAP